ncbi:hypothetical protein [Phaeocystidibacter luteus]|uniref:Uncharacterized protein n=1 Tax=Phaeocystidibacter luteus TaxID=911197 RepID=A0A6N6RIJ7_9FLAO|nr:hypothetical protein [Phaeocystidibacter luteus]KAB2810193.1 hypothetical protein F8C67_08135 [Phaeocystidibacter luteus]
MKNRITLTFFTALIFTLSSCNNNQLEEEFHGKDFPMLLSSQSYENVKHTINIGKAQEGNELHMINLNGEFKSPFGLLTTSGYLNFGQWTCPVQEDYFYRKIFDNQPEFAAIAADLDGKDVLIEYEVYGESQKTKIYSPENIDIGFSQDIRYIDKTEDLVITWDVDPNTPFEKCYVAFVSRGVDGIPDEYTRTLVIDEITDDDGEYIFPSSTFSSWPDDLWIDVIVMRGNQKFIEESGTLITVLNYNYTAGRIRD